MKVDISSLSQLEEFAKQFAQGLTKGDIVYLKGDLGSGKTTLTQYIIKQLGYNKRVKSPTYAIYETYGLPEKTIIHMDLYRLSSPQELYYLALEEIFDEHCIVIIEWPEKGEKVLPDATKTISLKLEDSKNRTLKLDIT